MLIVDLTVQRERSDRKESRPKHVSVNANAAGGVALCVVV
jgi:hypothetical protein